MNSKELQRDQATLSGDKELKANTLRSNGDQISRKTVELGKLKAQADQRKRDEAALRELEEYLVQLQADLKVSLLSLLSLFEGISKSERVADVRHWIRRQCLLKPLGGRRMISLLDIEMRGRMRRMTLGSRLGFIGLVWGRLRVNTNSAKRE
jgi:hypothetical protein